MSPRNSEGMAKSKKMVAVGKNSLIDNKLRRYVPKGKLAGMVKKPAMPRKEADPVEKEPMPMREPMRMSKPEPQPAENNELDELETQLRDIESRLKRMN